MAYTTSTLFALAASLALATGCQPANDDATALDTTATADVAASPTGTSNLPSDEDHRRFVDEVFNKGNVEFAGTYIADDFVDHTPGPGQEPGLAGFKKMITGMRANMPDMKMTVEHIVANGDMVAMHVRQTGTHTTSLMGEKPSGAKIDVAGVDLIRYENGKAKEHWGYYEEAKFMQQTGMMPPMPGSAPGAAAPGDTAAKQ